MLMPVHKVLYYNYINFQRHCIPHTIHTSNCNTWENIFSIYIFCKNINKENVHHSPSHPHESGDGRISDIHIVDSEESKIRCT